MRSKLIEGCSSQLTERRLNRLSVIVLGALLIVFPQTASSDSSSNAELRENAGRAGAVPFTGGPTNGCPSGNVKIDEHCVGLGNPILSCGKGEYYSSAERRCVNPAGPLK
jgi:hypothetical protein